LSPDDHATLKAALDTLAFVTAELQAKQTSLDRLRRLLFGATTEQTRTIIGRGAAPGAPGPGASPRAAAGPAAAGPPRPGHGRTGAAAYTGADTVKIPHPSLRRADRCPGWVIFWQKSFPRPNSSRKISTTSSAWLSSLAKISVLGTSVRPGKISVKSLALTVWAISRIWSLATT
jgi:hypothetical protein